MVGRLGRVVTTLYTRARDLPLSVAVFKRESARPGLETLAPERSSASEGEATGLDAPRRASCSSQVIAASSRPKASSSHVKSRREGTEQGRAWPNGGRTIQRRAQHGMDLPEKRERTGSRHTTRRGRETTKPGEERAREDGQLMPCPSTCRRPS